MSDKNRQFVLYSDMSDDENGQDGLDGSFLLTPTVAMSQRHNPAVHRKSGIHRHGPPSIVESLSTIPGPEDVTLEADSQEEVRRVYQELQEINDKLKREFKILHQRDLVLKQKEHSLSDLQMSLETAIDNEVKRRLAVREKEFQTELKKIDSSHREKNRENRRLKENFDALKNANDILRRELDTLTSSYDKLEKQHNSVQARFINLQRKMDHDSKKEQSSDVITSAIAQKTKPSTLVAPEHKTTVKKTKPSAHTSEVLASLLDWVCESQLRQPITDQPTRLLDPTAQREQLEDRCFKMLPSLIELLRDQSSPGSRMALPCLQFIYWALVHLENSQSQHQKTSLSSSLRRLGEDLYRGRPAKSSDASPQGEGGREQPPQGEGERSKERPSVFYRSSHLHMRLLSSLVILKTVTQVDYLAQVYETLRTDVKSDTGKEYFLYYQATGVILASLKPSNKTLTSAALDVYLQMAMDSVYLRSFLDACGSERWFQAVSLVWRMPAAPPKHLEKISILLQKLSKIRSNKKYFEVFGLTSSCQEVQRTVANQSPFLSLNLKSVLYNLSTAKTAAKQAT